MGICGGLVMSIFVHRVLVQSCKRFRSCSKNFARDSSSHSSRLVSELRMLYFLLYGLHTKSNNHNIHVSNVGIV